jgi:hypothetical protein
MWRQRDREIERQRERLRDRETKRDRDRDRDRGGGGRTVAPLMASKIVARSLSWPTFSTAPVRPISSVGAA